MRRHMEMAARVYGRHPIGMTMGAQAALEDMREIESTHMLSRILTFVHKITQ